jgi:hypothetical protein
MTEQEVPIGGQPLPPELSDRLKECGFDPGIPVYDIDPLDFDRDQIKRALFDSTYRNPITVTFRSDQDEWKDTPIGRGLEMVVELVRAVYVPCEPFVGSGLFGCYDKPEWYLRGFLYKSGSDPYPEVVRMHAYLEVDGGPEVGKIDRANVQVVRHPSGTDPSTPLVNESRVRVRSE